MQRQIPIHQALHRSQARRGAEAAGVTQYNVERNLGSEKSEEGPASHSWWASGQKAEPRSIWFPRKWGVWIKVGLLRACSSIRLQRHHLGTCQKCKCLGPNSDLLNQISLDAMGREKARQWGWAAIYSLIGHPTPPWVILLHFPPWEPLN